MAHKHNYYLRHHQMNSKRARRARERQGHQNRERFLHEYADFIWFEGDEMHLDAERYAELRNISLQEAIMELKHMAAQMLPAETPITEV